MGEGIHFPGEREGEGLAAKNAKSAKKLLFSGQNLSLQTPAQPRTPGPTTPKKR